MVESRGRLILAIVIAASGLACASAPKEVDLPPQSLTQAPTSTAEQEAALVSRAKPAEVEDEDPFDDEVAEKPPAAPAVAATETTGRKHTIVIQSGGTNSVVTPRSLQQASEEERERRAAGGVEAPVAVITNQNLAELAEGGSVTVVGGEGKTTVAGAKVGEGSTAAAPAGATNPNAAPAAGGSAPASAPAAGASASTSTSNAAASAAVSEEYWRSQALKIRLDWKAAVEEVDELQGEVADLRRRFYQEDDPHYRDNEIKPAWDRALDRLQDAKSTAEAQERKLTRFLEEGHRAGALPGWLREGLEYEPPATSDNTPSERRRSEDPWEPKILEEERRDP